MTFGFGGSGGLSGGLQATASLPATDLPAWLSGAAVNEAVEIADTVIRYGQGPGTRLSYSGLANHDALLILACTGGHGDSSDNGVDSLDLSANTPAWTQRREPFATPVTERNYYRTTPTVEPSSRHTYEYNKYNPVLDRLMLYTTSVPWGNSAPEVPQATNGLNLSTWDFDPAGTYVAAGGCYVQDSAGRAYSRRGYFAPNEYDPVSNTVTELPGFTGEVGRPIAYDSSRDVFFQCSYGDGSGGGPSRLLFRYSARFASQTAITFNSSAAATALLALADADATMFYVAALDAYFYWTGQVLYKITPNSGTVWDVSEVTITGATIPTLTSVQRDSHSRACYVPSLGVMAWLPNATSNLYCVRLV